MIIFLQVHWYPFSSVVFVFEPSRCILPFCHFVRSMYHITSNISSRFWCFSAFNYTTNMVVSWNMATPNPGFAHWSARTWMITWVPPIFLGHLHIFPVPSTPTRNGWTCREELFGLSREYMEKVIEAHVPGQRASAWRRSPELEMVSSW